MTRNYLAVAFFALGLTAAPAVAQQAAETPQAIEPKEGITILFPTGSGRLNRGQDQAPRLFRDGNPIVMVVTGSADTVGDPDPNLDLSIGRARASLRALSTAASPSSGVR